jgi:hypothetical protein
MAIDALGLSDKWLENFYKECGREVTLAYTTLNQMKNWAMIVAAAAISGLAFGTGAQSFPNERMFVGVAIVYTFVLRFFFRAIICYINLVRWNVLQKSCIQLMLDSKPYQREEAAQRFREDISLYYFRWLAPIDRKTQLVSNLKLGFALLFVLPLFFLGWGFFNLWASPLVEGMTTFVIGTTVIEVGDFLRSTIFDDRHATERRRSRRITSNFPIPSSRFGYLSAWLAVLIVSISVAGIRHHKMVVESASPIPAPQKEQPAVATPCKGPPSSPPPRPSTPVDGKHSN